jgi:hypothetical protein
MPKRSLGTRTRALTLAHSHREREGISLLEILISIFILAVGLLGVAALLPIGNSEVVKGSVAHRSYEVGQRAWREIRLRGYLNPENWVKSSESPVPVVDQRTGQLYEEMKYKPIAFDPLTMGLAPQNTWPWSRPLMPMITLGMSEGGRPGRGMSRQTAERIFNSTDTLIFERPGDDTLPPRQFKMGEEGSRRRSEALYSWMFTLVPDKVAQNSPGDPNAYVLSVVVFYRDRPDAYDGTPRRDYFAERVEALGGGAYRIRGQAEELKRVLRPRRWLMLTDGQRMFRWYRIESVDGSANENLGERVVTLAGPDWNPLSSGTGGTLAAVCFEGAVGVYERLVLLEGPTLWSEKDEGGRRAGG